MKFLSNKYLVLGSLVFLLIGIPISIYFVKRQQELRSRATPSSTLSIKPPTKTVNVGENFDLEVHVNPGSNIVSLVKLTLNYDKDKIDFVKNQPDQNFSLVLEQKTDTPGIITMSLNVGSDVTKAIQDKEAKVTTITFKAKAATTSTKIKFDQASGQNQVFSLSGSDAPGENVLSNFAIPESTITINEVIAAPPPPPPPAAAPSVATPSAAVSTPTTPTTPTSSTQAQAGPANQIPLCTSLSTDREASGSAPFAVTLTANGYDPDGRISKVTFDFGDGPVQEVLQSGGIGTNSVSVQATHSYNTAGTYTATARLTDDRSGVSTVAGACSKTITVGKAIAQVVTPTPAALAQAPTTPTPAAAITGKAGIEAPGDFKTTLAIIGGALVTIVGGIFLLGL